MQQRHKAELQETVDRIKSEYDDVREQRVSLEQQTQAREEAANRERQEIQSQVSREREELLEKHRQEIRQYQNMILQVHVYDVHRNVIP